MLIAVALLALLFVSSFLFTFFKFQSQTKNKLFSFKAWIQSYLFPKQTPPAQPLLNPAMDPSKKIKARSRAARETSHLRDVFDTFDKNKDGLITTQELMESLKNIGVHVAAEEAAEMVAQVDCNGDGLIDMDEFCMLYESVMGEERGSGGGEEDGEREEELREAFEVFDEDRDGLITVEELGSVLASMGIKEGMRVESCKEMIKKVDVDGDGKIDFEEFKRRMKIGGLAVAS